MAPHHLAQCRCAWTCQACRHPPALASFDSSILRGRWYIPMGLSKVIDCYDCQYGDFEYDNATQQRTAHFEFKAPMMQA